MQPWTEHSGLRSAKIADGKLFLVLNNSLAAVEDGRQEILRFLGPLDARPRNRLEIIFEELVSNIVRHGLEKESGQSIHVVVERIPGVIQLTFEDDGVPFNILTAVLPAPASSIETVEVGGLGIPLIVKLSSKLDYQALEPDKTAVFRPRNRTIVAIAI